MRPTEEEVSQLHGRTILNTAFHSALGEKRGGGATLTEKKKKERERGDRNRIEARNVRGGEVRTQRRRQLRCAEGREEIV